MRRAVTVILVLVCGWAWPAAAQEPGVRIGRALAVGPLGKRKRAAFSPDPIAAWTAGGQVDARDLRWPKEGDEVELHDGGKQAWHKPAEVKDGGYEDPALRGGYLSVVVKADEEGVFLLRGKGHSMVYVNGTPRIGDVYRTGFVVLPVKLRRDANHLLFSCARGAVEFSLERATQELFFNTGDVTAPDLLINEDTDAWGAIPLLNCTEHTQAGLEMGALRGGSFARTSLPPVPPLSVRKVPFRVVGKERDVGEVTVALSISDESGQRARADVKVRVRDHGQTRKVTFRSGIDGSIQYYGVRPAEDGARGKALILSLHGAGVEAIRQATAYARKSWAHIVAPTNRRPFGFDWEDWGRWDALEVLAHARKSLGADPRQTYLVGHSMGGHGTWHLGVTFPDKFAAIGPSAGWVSFWSYTGADRYAGASPISKMFLRATSPSDTLRLTQNLRNTGIYILHGADDDNVPVTQARTMREHLSKFHPGFGYHEEPGKKHWWNKSDEPGADCVDWPPMMDYLSRRSLPPSPRDVDFTTASPDVSARCHWAEIVQQERILEPSRVRIRVDPHKRRFVGATQNVAALLLDTAPLQPAETPIVVDLDGEKVEFASPPARGASQLLYMARKDGRWERGVYPTPQRSKRPGHYGPFKNAFRNAVVFVYGTGGGQWALAKARFDAETFWYRGNGSVDVVSDIAFLEGDFDDRNVVLYGNATTNRAWGAVFDESVEVSQGKTRIGDRTLTASDLGCLFVRPRLHREGTLAAAVSGTSLNGMRLCDRLPYFVSGVAYPDLTVFDAGVLTDGMRGVRVAGYFGNDWSVEKGDFAWRGDDAD